VSFFTGNKSSGLFSHEHVQLTCHWISFLAGLTCLLDFTGKFSGEAFPSHFFPNSHNIFFVNQAYATQQLSSS
jgi:hypothetical protein